MIYRGAPLLGAIVIGWSADRIGLQLAFALATFVCVLPWMRTFAQRATMTEALEGRSNDLDQRLLSATKAWAGRGYGRLIAIGRRPRR